LSEQPADNAYSGNSWPVAFGPRTHIMAIFNITPDSFSGDGLATERDVVAASIQRAHSAVQAGADILDVGGVASAAGLAGVCEEMELGRVLPVIRALAGEVGVPISIDSCRATVVEAALDAGASIVNSNWGMRTPDGDWNEPLAKVIAARRAPAVLAHNGPARKPATLAGNDQDQPGADPLVPIEQELAAAIDYAAEVGIHRSQLVIDPGIGQGKTLEQDWLILRDLGRFRAFGLPLLIGASRKLAVGSILGVPPEARDGGTAAVTALAAIAKVDVVRVHNVGLNSDVARVINALQARLPEPPILPSDPVDG
jgi:dihydropteroate synthase